MKKWIYIPGLLCFAALCIPTRAQAADNASPLAPLPAGCSGSSPNWTANDATSTSVQDCLSETLHCGDIITVPAGSATWTTTVTVSPPTGCSNYQGITIIGATTVSPENQGSTATSATDNTTITLAGSSIVAFQIGNAPGNGVPCSITSFCRVTGFTFDIPLDNDSHGDLNIDGTPRSVGFRFDHNHIVINSSNTGGIAMAFLEVYGLLDHDIISITDTTSADHCCDVYGDWPTNGGGQWAADGTGPQGSGLGTSANVYFEDSTLVSDTAAEEIMDCYQAGTYVLRHSTVTGTFVSCHGTDTGGFRSGFEQEVYDVTFTNSSGTSMVNSTRGGTSLNFDNTLAGTTGYYYDWEIEYFRDYSAWAGTHNVTNWGLAGLGIEWYLGSTTQGSEGDAGSNNNTGGSDWASSHSYAANAVIYPTSNNAGNYNYINLGSSCTSGGTRPSFNQTETPPGTTTDGTCTWTNAGGAAPGVLANWCAINRDTPATSNATCAALTSGDTATTWFDGTGTNNYPQRDQPGLTHNQVAAPIYLANNSGALTAGVCVLNSSSACVTNTTVQPYRDYYQAASGVQTSSSSPFSCNGSTGGTGWGTLANRPSSCSGNCSANTIGCGYLATDQGSQGILYVWESGAWTTYYTPYTYPYPVTPQNPSFSPAGGTYGTPQSVSLLTPSGGYLCWNTTGSPASNGSGGCAVGSTLYSGSVSVNSTETVYAVASSIGFSDSAVSSAAYTITVVIPAPCAACFADAHPLPLRQVIPFSANDQVADLVAAALGDLPIPLSIRGL